MLGINRRTLLSWLYQGKIPEPRRVGNKRVWSTEEVEELRKLIIKKEKVEMNQQYYSHKKSGETYVVQLNDNNQVTAIRGPLDYTEVRQDWLGKWDMTVAEVEDLEWYREHAEDFGLCESYYLPED